MPSSYVGALKGQNCQISSLIHKRVLLLRNKSGPPPIADLLKGIDDRQQTHPDESLSKLCSEVEHRNAEIASLLLLKEETIFEESLLRWSPCFYMLSRLNPFCSHRTRGVL